MNILERFASGEGGIYITSVFFSSCFFIYQFSYFFVCLFVYLFIYLCQFLSIFLLFFFTLLTTGRPWPTPGFVPTPEIFILMLIFSFYFAGFSGSPLSSEHTTTEYAIANLASLLLHCFALLISWLDTLVHWNLEGLAVGKRSFPFPVKLCL